MGRTIAAPERGGCGEDIEGEGHRDRHNGAAVQEGGGVAPSCDLRVVGARRRRRRRRRRRPVRERKRRARGGVRAVAARERHAREAHRAVVAAEQAKSGCCSRDPKRLGASVKGACGVSGSSARSSHLFGKNRGGNGARGPNFRSSFCHVASADARDPRPHCGTPLRDIGRRSSSPTPRAVAARRAWCLSLRPVPDALAFKHREQGGLLEKRLGNDFDRLQTARRASTRPEAIARATRRPRESFPPADARACARSSPPSATSASIAAARSSRTRRSTRPRSWRTSHPRGARRGGAQLGAGYPQSRSAERWRRPKARVRRCEGVAPRGGSSTRTRSATSPSAPARGPRGELDEAEPLFREALEAATRCPSRARRTRLNGAPCCSEDRGVARRGRVAVRAADERCVRRSDASTRTRSCSIAKSSPLLQDQGKLDEAGRASRESRRTARGARKPASRSRGGGQHQLGHRCSTPGASCDELAKGRCRRTRGDRARCSAPARARSRRATTLRRSCSRRPRASRRARAERSAAGVEGSRGGGTK